MTTKHKTEYNKQVVEKFLHDTHSGKVDTVDELVTADIVTHGFPCANPKSRADYKQFFHGLNAAFPEMKFAVNTMLAEGDKVAVHFLVEGNHRAEFMGIPATGRQVCFTGMVIYRLRDGRIAETWLQPDNVTLLKQLGALPTSAAA